MLNQALLVVLVFLAQMGYSQVRYGQSPTTLWDGRITVYFNGSIDSSRASQGNMANALENLEQRVIDAINSAKASLDMAAYELNSLSIVVALCKAKERGVRVRLIVDDQAGPRSNEDLWRIARNLIDRRYGVVWMTDAGWPWVKLKANWYKGHRAQMHNKFLIADAVTSDSTDDVVLTGSYNFTVTGLVSMQNLIAIRDQTIAKAFEQEFEQMWGSAGPYPDSLRSLFHQHKKTTPVAGVRQGAASLDVYFTPVRLDNREADFLKDISRTIMAEADHDIKICAFSFSAGIDIDESIRLKHESGIDVKAVFEPSLARRPWSLYSAMMGEPSSKFPWRRRPDARLAFEDRHLHHKYILVDAENPDSNDVPILISGSLNFSRNANDENDENFLILKDRHVANQFLQEFYARFNRAAMHPGNGTADDTNNEGEP